MGPVILSGDAVSFPRELRFRRRARVQLRSRRDCGLSIERIKKVASDLKATVIIQHDARDVEKLPLFPAFAK
jgi:N-acyl homoserine lactone hydrolase